MSKASDIERMLAHIGSPDMLYREFDNSRTEARARADWRLLDSASGGPGGAATMPESQSADVQTLRHAGSADIVRPRPITFVERELDMPAEPVASKLPEEPSAAPSNRGQLQRVFERLKGDAPAPQNGSAAAAGKPETPLSQLFRRLS